MSKTTTITPILTEKTYSMSSATNAVYAFDIDVSDNKHTVKRAVEAQFDVKVKSVRVLVNDGKAKRTIAKKGRKVYTGNERRSKKAYVTLEAKQNLPFFQAIEEEEKKQQENQAKRAKAVAKQDEKSAKAEAKSKSTVDKTPGVVAEKPKRRLHLGGRRGKDEENK